MLGAMLWMPQAVLAQSVMCVEPTFAMPTELAAAAQTDAPAPLGDDELPWCTGADDPRCAPLHGDSTALRLALRQPLAAAAGAGAERTAQGEESSEPTPHAGLLPRAGIRQRIERPPRRAR